MIGNDYTSADRPSYVQDAMRRRLLQFYARRWRPVPALARSAQPSFWATSWEDAQNQ